MNTSTLKYVLAAAVMREPYTGVVRLWPTLHFLRYYEPQNPEAFITNTLKSCRANHSEYIRMCRIQGPRAHCTPEEWHRYCTQHARQYRQHFKALARALVTLRNIDTQLF